MVARRFAPIALLAAFAILSSADVARAGSPNAFTAAAPAWLGVAMSDGADNGVGVRHVVRGSPAEKGGVRAGDRIVSIDGARVAGPTDVSRKVALHAPGDVLAVAVKRGDSDLTLRVELAARPSSDEQLRMDFVGAFAPAWTGTLPLTGAPAGMNDLRGRVVVLDFWASWCGPCRYLAPRLSQLQARYRGQGLAVIGMTTDDAETAAVAAERLGIHYGVVVDTRSETTQAYGVSGLPTLFVIDKRGVVRAVTVGVGPDGDAQLDALVQSLLAERAP